MTSERQANHKAFAGVKVSSMKRRAAEHDYQERCIYMITIAVEGHRPLLGRLEGEARAQRGTSAFPHVVPTPLGLAVQRAWYDIPHFHPEVRVLAFQLMPDHIHGILFVERPIQVGLGKVILGFKQGCNKAYRVLLSSQQSTQGGQLPSLLSRSQGLLFERGYHDRILLHAGQLDTMKAYIADNPYRLAVKRAHADLFQVRLGVDICGRSCSVVGNMNLLRARQLLQVRFSRSIAPALLQQEQQQLLAAAREGAVLVSPAISPGEKATMRAAFDAHLPLIVLLNNGLDPMSKPSGQRFYATAEERLLLISPFPHHGEKKVISRDECNQLNALAWDIAHAQPL